MNKRFVARSSMTSPRLNQFCNYLNIITHVVFSKDYAYDED